MQPFLQPCAENDLFYELVALTPEVCPEIPTPSQWAVSALNFHPDQKQMEVLDHHGHRVILNCCRQWGKTTLMAIKALHAAIFHPGTEIAVLSKSLQQAGVLLDAVCRFAAKLTYPRRRVAGNEHSLHLPNGSKIYGVADGRAHSPNIVIVDEAAHIEDDVIASATHSLARGNGKLWLLGTPNGESGLFYNVWHAAHLTEWFRLRVTLDEAPFATAAFIEEQSRLFPLTFRQDFHCEFLPAKDALISRVQIDAIIDADTPFSPFPSPLEQL